MIDLTGMILKERYCVLEQIGQGGEGRLYLARDMELGSLWAVKEIPASKKREAKLLRLLEHPSLPRMFDYAEKDEFCYLVMELIKGKSLGQCLKEGKAFTVREVVDFGIDLAGVMNYLHTRKPPVYYGDLKPDNIMLSQEGKVYLVDLGSAVVGFRDHPAVCQGTPYFAAPEQYQGKINESSDIYGMGKTMQALLERKWWKILWQAPGFLWILQKCCRREPGRRYRNMKELEDALKAVKRECMQSRLRMLLVSAATAVSLLTAGGLFFYREKKQTLSFSEALGEAVELYYSDQFLNGSKEEQRNVCASVEKRLQNILKLYQEKGQQRRVYLLLAANSEYEGKPEHAALYYEQLLLYDSGYGEAYGEYGGFLLRTGKTEESRTLWTTYRTQEKEKKLEEGNSRNLALWEEQMNEMEEKEDIGSGDQ